MELMGNTCIIIQLWKNSLFDLSPLEKLPVKLLLLCTPFGGNKLNKSISSQCDLFLFFFPSERRHRTHPLS